MKAPEYIVLLGKHRIRKDKVMAFLEDISNKLWIMDVRIPVQIKLAYYRVILHSSNHLF